MIASTASTWYVARAGGLVAFAALTISVLLGLTLSGRARLRYWPRFAVEDVHRFAGILAGAFFAVHAGALLVDGFMPISLGDLLLPGATRYRPVWTALGVVGAELLVALALTNRYRARLGQRTWRRLHYANFAVWGLALVHGLGAGSDTGTSWALALYLVSAGAVAGATVWRVLQTRPVTPAQRPVASPSSYSVP